MKAVVLAGDKGFSIDGQKNDIPKALFEINGKAMVEYVLEELNFIEKNNIIIVVGYEKEKIKALLGPEYTYIDQQELMGTANAVNATRGLFLEQEEDLLVCYCDMPLISRDVYKGILEKHQQTGADCTVLTAIAPKTGLQYGRIIRTNNIFENIIEYNICSETQKEIEELNVGIYVFKSGLLFKALENLLRGTLPSKHITDVPKIMIRENNKVETHTIHNTNQIYGINNSDQLNLSSEIMLHSKNLVKNYPAKWFGTGGWRGFIGEDFTKANLQILASAIAVYMKDNNQNEIVVGYDRRFLSDKAAIWAAEVFAANHISVYFISRISPTPLVMFTVKSINADMGISITASHNPADYNGVKVFLSDSSDASEDVTDIFESIIAKGVAVKAIGFDQGIRSGIIHMIDPNNDYIDSIIAMIDMDVIRSGNLRVLLDPMFGVSKTTLQTVLMTARCDVDIINDRHDTLFGGQLPSPTAKSLSKMIDMVVQYKYDLGIGTDGDADRIGIVDNNGVFVHPNEILMLLYHYLLKYKGWKGDCVRNLATTHVLDVIAEKHGAKCHEVPVGFKHISSKMAQTDAVIGGESSGGLTIRGHIKGKDGIFASALVVEMICATKKTIGELLTEIAADYGKTYFAEHETTFTAAKKQQLVSLLFEEKKLPKFSFPVKKVSYMDGSKVYFENGGWIVARFSGTEALLRIFCEMPEEIMANDVIKTFTDFLDL